MPGWSAQSIYRHVAGVVVALLLGGACAAAAAEEVYRVRISDHADIERIEAAGLSVSHLTPEGAVVYVPPGKLAELEALDLPYERLPDITPKAPPGYRDYDAVTADLEYYAATYPERTRLISLGQSVQGRELWALLITAEPDMLEAKPAVKYVSTMHGDEPLGTEMCLFFIDWLLSDYGADARITRLVDETYIWIVPLMNPDGYTVHSRFNANSVDLNRVFPQYPVDFTEDWYDAPVAGLEAMEPEVRHVIEWTLAHNFALSANMHTGELVVNYPYDDGVDIPSGMAAPTPDDALFQELSRRYAEQHPVMRERTNTLMGFDRGIVNGSRWYRITGSMQDWHYRYLGCKEVTLELSVTKTPPASELPTHWDYNAEAMLSYLEGAYQAAVGVVTDRRTEEPVWARVEVTENARAVYSHPESGYYHRLLEAGTHDLVVSAPGYIPYRLYDVEIDADASTRNDVALSDGDVNLDGDVNAVDIQLIVNAILGQDIGYDADVDGGGVTATDLQAVINVVLGY